MRKLTFAVLAALLFMGACAQRTTCPTYIKNSPDQEQQEPVRV